MSAQRTERLLNLVIALRATRRGMRRDDLRRAVPQYAASPNEAAFERMFERDKEDLREIGVPIVTVASDVLVDAEDAYRIDAGAYELPPVTLTPAEVAVLGLAAHVWQQGLEGVAVGSRVVLQVPPEVGYGAEGSPPTIPADADLVFVIDVLDTQTAPEAPAPAPSQ